VADHINDLASDVLDGAKRNPVVGNTAPTGNVQKPRNKQDVKNAVSSTLDSQELDSNDALRIYNAVQLALSDDNSSGTEMKNTKSNLSGGKAATQSSSQKKLEALVRESVRRQLKKLKEAGLSFSGWDTGSEEDTDEFGTPIRAKRKHIVGNEEEGTFDLESIGKEFGWKPSMAKKAVQQALAKLRFLVGEMSEEERDSLVASAIADYIKYLNTSGEVTPEELKLLKDHPDLVSELDGFREFASDYIKKEMRRNGAPEIIGNAPGDSDIPLLVCSN
jgi:hypothetical protein